MPYFGKVVVLNKDGQRLTEADCDLRGLLLGERTEYRGYLEHISSPHALASVPEGRLLFPNGEKVNVRMTYRETKIRDKSIVKVSFVVEGDVPDEYK